MKKRVMSLFMALALCLSMMPTVSYAEEAGAVTKQEAKSGESTADVYIADNNNDSDTTGVTSLAAIPLQAVSVETMSAETTTVKTMSAETTSAEMTSAEMMSAVAMRLYWRCRKRTAGILTIPDAVM